MTTEEEQPDIQRRRVAARKRQRRRRQKYVRIDFYPDQEVYDQIESMLTEEAPLNSMVSAINYIVREWMELTGRDRKE